MIITIVSAKGGVGKTTSAIYLAEAFARRDISARVIDMDPHGSASRWYDLASDGDSGEPLWSVENLTEYRLGQLRDDGRPVIIDCTPHNPRVIDMAAQMADMTVIPCPPEPEDLHRAVVTYDTLPTNKSRLLVNMVDLRTGYQDVLEMLDTADDGHPLRRFKTLITHRKFISYSNGTIPKDLNGYDELLDEIEKEIDNG